MSKESSFTREVVESAEPDPAKIWMVAPHDVELPTGFPFKKLTGDTAQLFRALIDLDSPIVIALKAEQISDILVLAKVLNVTTRHLEHTAGDYSAFWHMHTKSLPTITVRELMETRSTEPVDKPPTLKSEDLADYSTLLNRLDSASEEESADED